MPLSVVLHTHMPYVEGYGTWPFGEEWLWEAMATSYMPLLDVLEDAPEVTLSLTPVLADQLEAPGVGERFLAFLRDVRTETHRRDIASAESPEVARALEQSAAQYAAVAERFDALGGDLLGALGRYAAWTSSATHAVLPLVATDAGVRLQVRTGIESHRRRFGGWNGGFWSPECAHAPWLDPLLEEAGVHATCVDLTDVYGMGAPDHLTPVRSAAGPLLVPIDRSVIELVWHPDGYPSRGAYCDTTRRTEYEHLAWSVEGGAYDRDAALTQAREDAADFVSRAGERAAQGLCVCALDTELLGHWWREGVAWLGFVVEECRTQGVELVHLDEALASVEPAGVEPDRVTTWGRERDLRTWSGPQVAGFAQAQRDAELRTLARGADVSSDAVRALLAVQASDWAFVVSEELAEPYGRERFAGHLAELDAALAGETSVDIARGIAPHATAAPLFEP